MWEFVVCRARVYDMQILGLLMCRVGYVQGFVLYLMDVTFD